MSRVGRMPVTIPAGVAAKVEKGRLTAKGPMGELALTLPRDMSVTVDQGQIRVERPSNSKIHRSLHGLTRALIHSAVVGVTKGYQKALEINGVGYRAEMKGKNLVLHLGYTHPITMEPPAGIEYQVPEPTKVVVKGADKQVVGQQAADIRGKRPPEPYKGKGIKYQGEQIRRKAGKTAAG